MNEFSNALRIANVAFKTVRAMDVAKKVVAVSATVACCCLAVKLWRNI